jgi:hypothetical protein
VSEVDSVVGRDGESEVESVGEMGRGRCDIERERTERVLGSKKERKTVSLSDFMYIMLIIQFVYFV